MEKIKVISLLEKILAKTKSDQLSWSCLSAIKSGIGMLIPEFDFYSYNSETATCSMYRVLALMSYRAEYRGGFIYVVKLSQDAIFLFIQPSVNDGAVYICDDACDDMEISTRLRRFHTLLRTKANRIDLYVDRFLND